jgi:glycosyltransferase involved in cell wall biosynthesis
MLRVLHLSAEPADEQSRRLSELLTSRAAPAAVIERHTIGRGGTYRSVVEAVLRLRRDLSRFDLLHAWDAASLSTAGWMGASNVLASFSGTLPRLRPWEMPNSIRWVSSTAYQQALVRSRLGTRDRCSLIEPGMAAIGHNPLSRDVLRARLGLGQDDRVLLAPGQSTSESGHQVAVWVTSMLHIIDGRYKLLIAGKGPYAIAAKKRAAALNRRGLLVVATDAGLDGPLHEAADAVLLTPTGPSPVLPVAESMAAGLPVVATDHPALCGFVVEGRGALLADWKKPPAVARRVLELFERPELLAEVSGQARREAAVRFSPTTFVERYLAVYRETAGLAPGATLSGAA